MLSLNDCQVFDRYQWHATFTVGQYLCTTCGASYYCPGCTLSIPRNARARSTLGSGYSAQGPIKTSVVQVATTEQAHGTLSLLVSAQGTWGYQFSSAEISQLARRIAGLPRQEAVRLLKRDPIFRWSALPRPGMQQAPPPTRRTGSKSRQSMPCR